ncbi:MAG: LysE family translocator [Formosimonas sp.]
MTDLITYTAATFVALLSFAYVSSITPGPNNIMLLHSGARFGFKRSVPHLLGVSLGFGFMLFLCCIGVAAVILQVPYAQTVLKVAGCAYMLWLTYNLWQSGALPDEATLQDDSKATAKPMTFMQAALFQYVNPKAWMMGLSVPSAYLPSSGSIVLNSVFAVVFFTLINLACCGTWVQGGAAMRGLMRNPRLAQVVNWTIVLMTLYCAVSVWLP